MGPTNSMAVACRSSLTGCVAWVFWLFLHNLYLAGFRNSLRVLIEWGYSYFTYERGARLITTPARERQRSKQSRAGL